MRLMLFGKTNWRFFGVALGLGLVFFSGGCALFGGGGGSLQRASGYQVKAPANWKSADAHGESDVAYRLPSGHVATLTSSCNSDSKAPLEILTKNLLLGARHVEVLQAEHLSVDKADGLHSSVSAMFEDAHFYLQLFVLPKSGCLFDFSLISPKPISEEEKREFMQFVKSFTYGRN